MGGCSHTIAAASVALAACSLTSLDGLSGGALPGADGGEASVPDTDAASVPDADAADAGSNEPVVIASDVGSARATGVAQGSHLLYAKNAGRWILFYEDAAAPSRLKTRLSTDLVTWSEGAALDLPYPHLGEGRNLAVAFLDTGKDVFHVSLSLRGVGDDRRHFHGRAVLQGSDLVFDALTEVGSTVAPTAPGSDPDAPAVVALSDGRVLDVSGWYPANVGDFDVVLSSTSDTGGSWSPVFDPMKVFAVVPASINARLLLPTFAGVFALWEAGDVEPNPTGVSGVRYDGSNVGPVETVGFPSTPFDPNDWSGARLNDASVHVVRWAGSYEHRIFNGSSWGPGSAIPDAAHAAGAGTVLLAYDGELALFAIESMTGVVRTTSWTGGAWTAWRALAKADVPRSQLCGYAGPGGVVLTWMEARAARLDVVARRVR